MTTAAHFHDLPPKWDSVPVQWEPWENSPTTLCVKGLREPCGHCGSRTHPVAAHGTRIVPIPDSVVSIGLPAYGATKERIQRMALLVLRCPDCRHDTVWDPWTDEWWDLDDSDYGDEGSFLPA